jgi:hypothetical protein
VGGMCGVEATAGELKVVYLGNLCGRCLRWLARRQVRWSTMTFDEERRRHRRYR